MKKSKPNKQLSVKDMSAAKQVIVQLNSLHQVKGGGGVIVEDILL